MNKVSAILLLLAFTTVYGYNTEVSQLYDYVRSRMNKLDRLQVTEYMSQPKRMLESLYEREGAVDIAIARYQKLSEVNQISVRNLLQTYNHNEKLAEEAAVEFRALTPSERGVFLRSLEENVDAAFDRRERRQLEEDAWRQLGGHLEDHSKFFATNMDERLAEMTPAVRNFDQRLRQLDVMARDVISAHLLRIHARMLFDEAAVKERLAKEGLAPVVGESSILAGDNIDLK